VRHYFIDEFPVTAELTAADFEKLSLKYLEEIFATHDTAVICGGTGLYIKALCEGLDEMPAVDTAIEQQTENDYEANGIGWLQNAVKKEDPLFYEYGEIHNPARMLRALSFIRTTGKSIEHYRSRTQKERSFNIIKVGLELPREILYERINSRVDKMMEEGLLEEAEQLFPLRHLKNLQTVGYAELFGHMEGKCTLPHAIEKIKQHSRNYAKRQMTWFRKETGMHWFRADDNDVVEKILALR
jgi:tRNA dimethylallyltransferase